MRHTFRAGFFSTSSQTLTTFSEILRKRTRSTYVPNAGKWRLHNWTRTGDLHSSFNFVTIPIPVKGKPRYDEPATSLNTRMNHTYFRVKIRYELVSMNFSCGLWKRKFGCKLRVSQPQADRWISVDPGEVVLPFLGPNRFGRVVDEESTDATSIYEELTQCHFGHHHFTVLEYTQQHHSKSSKILAMRRLTASMVDDSSPSWCCHRSQ